jgi:glycosyltransferase involved in cell wall biosynthesis
MSRLRVAVLADYLEERWPSMDLVAEMLMDRLTREHATDVEATLVRPPLRGRLSRVSKHRRAFAVDRVLGRLWDYPRAVASIAGDFDLFHLVDHSYAQLVHELPAARTIVTCHDLDTFRSVLDPAGEPRGAVFRAMTRRILSGLRAAGHIVCDTSATRDALVLEAGIAEARTSVVHNGPHPSCTPCAEPAADRDAARLVGAPRAFTDLLHVGSTISRKRIDVLIRIVAAVRTRRPGVRLIRVGGPFTAEQAALARDLGIDDTVVLPFVDRATLAAIYRHSAVLVLPSEREGFGLPVVEAMACGTPVLASDIPALREVGGDAATYCAVDDPESWSEAIAALLDERVERPDDWARRREAAVRRAEAFSWSRYAAEIVALYTRLSGRADAPC